MLAMIKVLA